VLLAHDPDVSIGRSADDNMHWLVINIPGSARQLPEGQPPTTALPGGGIQLKNTRGSIGYRAPAAPAQGPYHHYVSGSGPRRARQAPRLMRTGSACSEEECVPCVNRRYAASSLASPLCGSRRRR